MEAHALFAAAAYGVSAAGVGGLILWVWLDGRARLRELRALEESGVRRRSDQAAAPEPR